MVTHRYHPDLEDPEDAILYDNCERCAEHARNLVSLDAQNLRLLFRRMREVEYGKGDEHYRTGNESLACYNISVAQRVMEKIRREEMLR